MQETTNYKLKKYQTTDAPNLITGYNASMDIIDTQIKAVNTRVDSVRPGDKLPDGLVAFLTALGVTAANAETLGTTLNHILNKTAATAGTYTVDMLAKSQVTAEGHVFVPDETEA